MVAAVVGPRSHLDVIRGRLEEWGLDDEAAMIGQAIEACDYVSQCLETMPDAWVPPPGGAPLGEHSILVPNALAKNYFGGALEGVTELRVIGRPAENIYLVEMVDGPHAGAPMVIQRDHFGVKKRVKPSAAPVPQMDLEEEIASNKAQEPS